MAFAKTEDELGIVIRKRCDTCGLEFIPRKGGAYPHRYCSLQCRRKHWHIENDVKWSRPRTRNTTGVVGAYNELRAAADLLAKGYEVFRAVTPHNSCDLIALRNGRCIRVEVRTGYESERTGQVWVGKGPDPNRYDLLAIATESKIVYEPELDTFEDKP